MSSVSFSSRFALSTSHLRLLGGEPSGPLPSPTKASPETPLGAPPTAANAVALTILPTASLEQGSSAVAATQASLQQVLADAVESILRDPDPLKAYRQWQSTFVAPADYRGQRENLLKSVRAQVEERYYTAKAQELLAEYKSSGSDMKWDDWLRKEKRDLWRAEPGSPPSEHGNKASLRSAIEKKGFELLKAAEAERDVELQGLVATFMETADPRKEFFVAKEQGLFTRDEARRVRELLDAAIGDGQAGEHSLAWLLASPDPVKSAQRWVDGLVKTRDKGLNFKGQGDQIAYARRILDAVKKVAGGGTLTEKDLQDIASAEAKMRRAFVAGATYQAYDNNPNLSEKTAKAIQDAYDADFKAWQDKAVAAGGTRVKGGDGIAKPANMTSQEFRALTGPAPRFSDYEKGGPKYPFKDKHTEQSAHTYSTDGKLHYTFTSVDQLDQLPYWKGLTPAQQDALRAECQAALDSGQTISRSGDDYFIVFKGGA